MTEINFTINLQVRFEDVPEELADKFIREGLSIKKLDAEFEHVIQSLIRDYHVSWFEGHDLLDDAVKDLFLKTSGADPTAVVQSCEEE